MGVPCDFGWGRLARSSPNPTSLPLSAAPSRQGLRWINDKRRFLGSGASGQRGGTVSGEVVMLERRELMSSWTVIQPKVPPDREFPDVKISRVAKHSGKGGGGTD